MSLYDTNDFIAANRQQMAANEQRIQQLRELNAQRNAQMQREILAQREAMGARDPEIEALQRKTLELNVDRTIESANALFTRSVANTRQNIDKILKDMPPDKDGKPMTREKALAMLTDMEKEFAIHSGQVRKEVIYVHQRSAIGATTTDQRWQAQQLQQQSLQNINVAHNTALEKTFHERYGAQGDALYKHVTQESHDLQQGPLGRAFSKMGTIGGVIGAVAGGALAFFGLGGMNGGFLSIIGTAVAALAGGVLGGTINNWIADSGKYKTASNTPPKDTPSGDEPEKKKAESPEKEKGEELTTGNLKPAEVPAPPKPARTIGHT